MLHTHEWGRGAPVIALHPLGPDGSTFRGFGRSLSRRGLRTIGVDLPGFGKTPAPDAPLTPAVLAAPVVTLARKLTHAGEPPVVLGISMGGRVALEVGLVAPEAVRAVIAIAPGLPWLRLRSLLVGAYLLSPRAAEWLPLEWAWPALRWLAGVFETAPYLRDDELAQAAARFVYYVACPATRASFVSAARELALDPPLGEGGFWTRLPGIEVPTAFVWGERDQIVSSRLADDVARLCPAARQMLLPCVSHWINGPHHQCLAEAVAELVEELHASDARLAVDGMGAAVGVGAVAGAGAAESAFEGAAPDRPGAGAPLATRPCLVDRSGRVRPAPATASVR